MLVAQLLPFVKNLSTRKWSDEDVIDDVKFLRDELTLNFQSLTHVLVSGSLHVLTHSMQKLRRIYLGISFWALVMDTGSRV